MDGFSGLAAAGQISQQVIGIINTTRTAFKDFRSAAEDHKTLSNEFASIFKIIEFTSDVLQRAAERLTNEELKNALNNESIESLLGGIRRPIADAQKILDKHKALRRRDRIRLVGDKGSLLKAQARLSNAGIHLSMFHMTLLVDGVAGGSSQASLTEVLTLADVKATLDEALKSFKEEIRLDAHGKSTDTNDATPEQPRSAAKKIFANFRAGVSNISLSFSRGPEEPQDPLQRHPSVLSGSGIESRPQTAPADSVPVSATDASSPTSTSKDQEAHQEGSLHDETHAESSSDILKKTRTSSSHVSDESGPSPPVPSLQAGLETPSHRTSSGPTPRHTTCTKDGATQTSPILAPFTKPEEDDEIRSTSIDTEERLFGWGKNRDETSSWESSSESSQELHRPWWMNLALNRNRGLLMSDEKFVGLLKEAAEGLKKRPLC